MAYLRFPGRFIVLCVCVGLLALLAACGSTAANQLESAAHTTSAPKAVATTVVTATAQVNNQSSSTPVTAQPTLTKGITIPSPTVAPVHTPAVVPATPTSAPAAPSGPLSLALACSGPNAQDGFSATNTHARACVYTSAGASLTIAVNFCNGNADSSQALQGTFTANNSGFYEWDWTPKASCHPISSWSVTINAQLSGQTASVSRASANS